MSMSAAITKPIFVLSLELAAELTAEENWLRQVISSCVRPTISVMLELMPHWFITDSMSLIASKQVVVEELDCWICAVTCCTHCV